MNAGTRTLLRVTATVLAITATLTTAAHAQDPKRAIVGTWFVQQTFRNCADGTVVGTGFAMNTFSEGGTMMGTPGAPVAASRTGHGVWAHVAGKQFSNRIILFQYTPQTGAFLRMRLVTRRPELDDTGNQFTSTDTDQLYVPSTLAPIGNPGCGTTLGRRLP
jgi:hypothetical protein